MFSHAYTYNTRVDQHEEWLKILQR
jgi:hypothetical protein